MKDKEKIASFISYHNILRPIELSQLTIPFLSVLLFLLYFTGFFMEMLHWQPEKLLCLLGMLFSAVLFVAGILFRKKFIHQYKDHAGKTLYSAEIWQYLGMGIGSFTAMVYTSGGEKNLQAFIIFNGIALAVIIATMLLIPVVVSLRIEKGVYEKKKHISDRMVKFFASGACVGIAVIGKNILLSTSNYNALLFLSLFFLALTEISVITAVVYYLKLRYAKKYNLEEYLPKGPGPSIYTGEK